MARITNQQKQNIVTDYQLSDLSIAEYCKKHNLSRTNLYNWIRKQEPTNVSKSFIKVSPQMSVIEGHYSIHLPNGIQIHTTNPLTVDQITAMMRC
jgi:hypothetical protein